MDYGNLKIEVRDEDKYSFVGISKNNGQLTLRLPIGYDKIHDEIKNTKDEEKKFEKIRDLHIKLYKLIRIYRVSIDPRNLKEQGGEIHKPSAQQAEEGVLKLTEHEGNNVSYYKKFDTFDCLLDAYDPVRILALQYRLRIVSDEFDMRNFTRSLGNAVFLDDDSFYIDRDYQPRPTINLATTDIVGMYSFLLCDMLEHLYPDADTIPVPEEISVIADDFKARHLWPSASCWKPKQWKTTNSTCKDILDKLHKHTAVKDDDYWNIYEAVERFLYDISESESDRSDNEELMWGMKGFWPVWEMLCFDMLLRICNNEIKGNILYADFDKFTKYNNYKPETQDDLQEILIDNLKNDNVKFLKPDIIIGYVKRFESCIPKFKDEDNKACELAIIDFKYKIKKQITGESDGSDSDIVKQLKYEDKMNQHRFCNIKSNFFMLPGVKEGDEEVRYVENNLESSFPVKYVPIDALITECIKKFDDKH